MKCFKKSFVQFSLILSYFIEENSKAQRKLVICPVSPAQVMEADWILWLFGLKVHVPKLHAKWRLYFWDSHTSFILKCSQLAGSFDAKAL